MAKRKMTNKNQWSQQLLRKLPLKPTKKREWTQMLLKNKLGNTWRWDPISRLYSSSRLCHPNPGPVISMTYVVVFFVFNSLIWKMIVGFIDNDEIVVHHCFNILFIIKYLTDRTVPKSNRNIIERGKNSYP
jgi:hypothetical protein